MTTAKSYDYLNRLTSISQSGTGFQPVAFNYSYNSANQRTKDTLADSSYWRYEYDALGQVRRGARFWAEGTPVAGQQFEYGYDDIGNRTNSKAGGDQSGAGLRPASYSANSLNQITSRDVPGAVDVMGIALATNTVTVNGQATYRKVEYYRKELTVNNSSVPVWQSVTVTAPGESTVNGNSFVPKTPEQFSYDADGNLTNDGRWSYTWDAENRLIAMATNTTVGPPYQLTFVYDSKGRRIQKTVSTNGVSATTKFLYDGWNLIAEVGTSGSLVRSYVRGTDLSGSMQGAGGVGGLLEVSYYGTTATNCFAAYDGNGNVAALINVADGKVAANYEYAAFGEPIRDSGPMAKADPLRFSTKYQDDETDLLYYGYRFYNPSTGRWPNRDPYDEDGFMMLMDDNDIPLMEPAVNPYLFTVNDPLTHLDWLGLKSSGGSGASSNDRASCCAKAKKLRLDHGNVGGGVCCDGKMYACVWIRGGATGAKNKKAKQVIDYCSYLHELHHLPDSAPCPACGTSRTKFKNGVDSNQGECDAYKVEVSCLNRGLKECKGDKQCIQQVTAEINSDEDLMKNTYHCK